MIPSVIEPPHDDVTFRGAASHKWEQFRAEDAESAEAKHLLPALGELAGTVLGLPFPIPGFQPGRSALSPQQAAKLRADHAVVHRVLLAFVALLLVIVLALEGPAGLAALLPVREDTPSPRSPQRAAYESAREDVTLWLAGDEAALGRVTNVHGTSAFPSLLSALRDAPEASTRRRAAHALRIVASAQGGTLMEPDLAIVDHAAEGDADPQVRGDCAAARERLTVFRR